MDSQKPEFLIGRMDESQKVQEVTGITAVNTYLIQFKDAQGKDCTNLGFYHPESGSVFLLQEKIGNAWVATRSNRWFQDSFNRQFKMSGVEAEKKGEKISKEEGLPQV